MYTTRSNDLGIRMLFIFVWFRGGLVSEQEMGRLVFRFTLGSLCRFFPFLRFRRSHAENWVCDYSGIYGLQLFWDLVLSLPSLCRMRNSSWWRHGESPSGVFLSGINLCTQNADLLNWNTP